MTGTEIVMLDADALVQAIQSRRLSCLQVMDAYLAQIERHNAAVNAIVSLIDPAQLREQARERDRQLARGQCLGWMHGLPHVVKDLAATQGLRTTLGSPLTDAVPRRDDLHVRRIREAGALIIGKSNVSEFGFGSHTYNPVFGTTTNAYDPTKSAGGSSGGAAVALALRMTPVADGSDMMGSLRNPAAFNNVYGFRPTFGRVPNRDGELFVQTLACDGPMGRRMRDLVHLYDVMRGADPGAPLSFGPGPGEHTDLSATGAARRIGWLGDWGGYLAIEPEILALCERSLGALAAVGYEVTNARPAFDPARLWRSWLTHRHAYAAGMLGTLYEEPALREQLKPEIRWEIEGGQRLTVADLWRASATRSEWYRAMARFFERFDFLALPSAQVFPFDAALTWPRTVAGRTMDTYHRWMEVVIGPTMAALPALSVPVGFGAAGLPAGMQLVGPHGADESVLQLGLVYEGVQPWALDHLPAALGAAGKHAPSV